MHEKGLFMHSVIGITRETKETQNDVIHIIPSVLELDICT